MNKVAVWGPNRYCNFGDDLQSVVFALHLKSLGYEPVLFWLVLLAAVSVSGFRNRLFGFVFVTAIYLPHPQNLWVDSGSGRPPIV